MLDNVLFVVYLAGWLLAGLVLHEYAHASVATRLGDPSPRMAGRLTLDPRALIDPFGTVLLPTLLLLPLLFGRAVFLPFAYAKPVPVDPWRLRGGDRSVVWVALAGPATNLVLVVLIGLVVRLIGVEGEIGRILAAGLLANVSLAVFNLLPIPPLDGSRVVARFLPPRAREVYANLDQYGALFILLIFFLLAGPVTSFVVAVGGGVCELVVGQPCPLL